MWQTICTETINLQYNLRKQFTGAAIPDINDLHGGYGTTPLAFASYWGCLNLVEILLQYGADTDAPDKYGDTPLICAAKYSCEQVTNVLIDYGANINAVDHSGKTALMWTAIAGADLEFKNKQDRNKTALHYAVLCKDDFQEAVRAGKQQRADSIRRIKLEVEKLLQFYSDVAQVIAEFAFGQLRRTL